MKRVSSGRAPVEEVGARPPALASHQVSLLMLTVTELSGGRSPDACKIRSLGGVKPEWGRDLPLLGTTPFHTL